MIKQTFNPRKAGLQMDTDGNVNAVGNQEFLMQSHKIPWHAAETAMAFEQAWLAHLASGNEFDHDRYVDEITDNGMTPFDLGVVGITMALQAAGCLTLSSCVGQGSLGDVHHNESCPSVAFYATPDVAAILHEITSRHGVDMYFHAGTKVIIMAAEETQFKDLIQVARAIIDDRKRFDSLPGGKHVHTARQHAKIMRFQRGED